MRPSLCCVIGAAGIAAASWVAPASADDLKSVVRTLNAILNPEDAQRLEDQARRDHRVEDERYWRNYRAGLEEQRRMGGGGSARGMERNSDRIGLEDARRLEERARRNGRPDEARYWHNYAAGLEGGRPDRRGDGVPGYREAGRNANSIGPAEAYRLEEQARRNGRPDEARYWAAYRMGLDADRGSPRR